MKRLLILLSIAIMLLSLTTCGNKSSNTSDMGEDSDIAREIVTEDSEKESLDENSNSSVSDSNNRTIDDEMARFLNYFIRYYYSGDSEDKEEFDAKTSDSPYLIETGVWLGSATGFPYDKEYIEGNDPRGWWGGVYESASKDMTDYILATLYNMNDNTIDSMIERAEKEKEWYVDNGRYITQALVGGGYGLWGIEIVDMHDEGDLRYVEYYYGIPIDPSYTDFSDSKVDQSKDYGHYYAILELKEIDDNHYWTIHRNSESKPW